MDKLKLIAELKTEYPTLTKQVNDEVIELDQDEYEATLDVWADTKLVQLSIQAEADAKAEAKAALLAQLGITEEQAKLLLS